jgi:hypothetical protein
MSRTLNGKKSFNLLTDRGKGLVGNVEIRYNFKSDMNVKSKTIYDSRYCVVSIATTFNKKIS